MAQDFENSVVRSVGTSGDTVRTANSDDAIVGLRFANILTTTDTLDVFITDAGDSDNARYLIKGVSVPASSSLEVIQGASKVIIQSGDVVKAQSGTANGFDCWISLVDTISS